MKFGGSLHSIHEAGDDSVAGVYRGYSTNQIKWKSTMVSGLMTLDSLHWLLMSVGVMTHHKGFLDVRRSCGGLRISRWIGQRSCERTFVTSLSVAAFLRMAGGSMLARCLPGRTAVKPRTFVRHQQQTINVLNVTVSYLSDTEAGHCIDHLWMLTEGIWPHPFAEFITLLRRQSQHPIFISATNHETHSTASNNI